MPWLSLETWIGRRSAAGQPPADTPRNALISLDERANEDWPSEIHEVVHGLTLLHILRKAAEARLAVTLNAPLLEDWTATRLVAIDSSDKILMIRRFEDARHHEAVVRGGCFNLMLRWDGRVLVSTMRLQGLGRCHDQVCYVSSVPNLAVSSQSRAWHRIRLPALRPMRLEHAKGSEHPMMADVVNISEGGFGLVAPRDRSTRFRVCDQWSQTYLHAGEETIGPLCLEVRNLREEGLHLFAGVMITHSGTAQMQRLRRLLMQLQTYRS